MKRLAKFSFYLIAGVLAIALVLFSGFRVVEHFKGNDYISYLENNIESTDFSEPLTFNIMEEDLRNTKLILIGEVHGFKANTEFDPQFFSYLHKEHNIKDYVIEMDMAQAYYMNEYNRTGNENLLKRVLENWVVIIGRKNSDYQQKWKKLRDIYINQGAFTYYGNNNISDINLLVEYVKDQFNIESLINPQDTDSLKLVSLKKAITASDLNDSLKWTANYILKNIDYSLNTKNREEILTNNLIDLYDHFNLSQKQVYGYYGLGHTMLNPISGGYESMASRFKNAKPEMDGKILAANLIYLDSHMTMNSDNLPSILRDEGEFTMLSVSYDNIWMNYLHGIDELRRSTNPHSISIVKLNSKNSPYMESRRLSTMSQILPLGPLLNSLEGSVTTDINQYMILIRNSEGAL